VTRGGNTCSELPRGGGPSSPARGWPGDR
jgi:hypothetical protein